MYTPETYRYQKISKSQFRPGTSFGPKISWLVTYVVGTQKNPLDVKSYGEENIYNFMLNFFSKPMFSGKKGIKRCSASIDHIISLLRIQWKTCLIECKQQRQVSLGICTVRSVSLFSAVWRV